MPKYPRIRNFPVQPAAFSVSHIRIPLKRPIKHASHTRDYTDSLLAMCRLPDGTTGWGEGLPRDYVTGETVQGALDLLRESGIPGQLRANSWREAMDSAEALRLRPVPGDSRGIGGNAARCAVELAWLDACGRKFGQGLDTVVPALAPELHAPQTTVRYSVVITSAKGRKLKWLARLYGCAGFRQVKVKVGIEGQDDLARLTEVRRIMGQAMGVRIDANEAWTTEKAVTELNRLKCVGLEWVEQPCPVEANGGLREVRAATGVAVMLDESLCGMPDADAAIAGGWCDLFNLRLSKCGGFIPSLRLAQKARQAGLRCQLGCQVGETGVLTAAGRRFAQSVAGLAAVEGSYDRHLVKERLTTRDLTFGLGGKAPALTTPGLGVELDPAAVARVTVKTENLCG